jgi:hypothetical protein
MFCCANIHCCLLYKSNKNNNLVCCDCILFNLSTQKIWPVGNIAWSGGMFIFMAILGGWGLDQLPSGGQFKLVAATQCIFK